MAERQQWEYSTTRFNLSDKQAIIEALLHEAGAQGWELVGIAPMHDAVLFVFKRPGGSG
jgi:hypothetical protein